MLTNILISLECLTMNWLVTEVSSVSLLVCAVNYINSMKTLFIYSKLLQLLRLFISL